MIDGGRAHAEHAELVGKGAHFHLGLGKAAFPLLQGCLADDALVEKAPGAFDIQPLQTHLGFGLQIRSLGVAQFRAVEHRQHLALLHIAADERLDLGDPPGHHRPDAGDTVFVEGHPAGQADGIGMVTRGHGCQRNARPQGGRDLHRSGRFWVIGMGETGD